MSKSAQSAAADWCSSGRDFDYEYFPPHLVDHHQGHGKIDFCTLASPQPRYQGLELGLLGPHQGANAAVAIATIGELQKRGWSIGPEHIRAGLAEVQAPARVQIVSRRPTVIIDAAHNVASVVALLDTLRTSLWSSRDCSYSPPLRTKTCAG